MSANDLILSIFDSENGNIQSTIDLINDLICQLLDENIECSFGNQLANELELFCERRGYNSITGEKLKEQEYFTKDE